MSENDPTDHALAAIASFIDKPPDVSGEGDADAAPETEAHAAPEPETAEQASEPAGETAASMPDFQEPSPDPQQPETYIKYGPGPLTAVRFKWSTRRGDNGDYFVDETIGESSYPLVTGPMTREAAIKFVDERERDARQRFETLRSEMAGREIGQSPGE